MVELCCLQYRYSVLKRHVSKKNSTRVNQKGISANNRSSQIKQLTLNEGELISIGTDGNIHVWDLEKIDQAECEEGQMIYEMEPMNTLKVPLSEISSMIMCPENDTIWYAQDEKGGIWQLDLSFGHTTAQPKKLAHYHGQPVTGLSPSPQGHLFVSTGDQQVRITDVSKRKFVCKDWIHF